MALIRLMLNLRNYIMLFAYHTCTLKNQEYLLNRMMEEADESGEPVLQCACQVLFDMSHDIITDDQDYLNKLDAIYTIPVIKDAVKLLQQTIHDENQKFGFEHL